MFSKNFVETSRAKASGHIIWRWMLVDPALQIISYINLCIEIKREREILAKLTDAELNDIGIHRGDADAEARRSIFDVPEDRMNLYNEQPECNNQSAGTSRTIDF